MIRIERVKEYPEARYKELVKRNLEDATVFQSTESW